MAVAVESVSVVWVVEVVSSVRISLTVTKAVTTFPVESVMMEEELADARQPSEYREQASDVSAVVVEELKVLLLVEDTVVNVEFAVDAG